MTDGSGHCLSIAGAEGAAGPSDLGLETSAMEVAEGPIPCSPALVQTPLCLLSGYVFKRVLSPGTGASLHHYREFKTRINPVKVVVLPFRATREQSQEK
jgi:hypothetical protein